MIFDSVKAIRFIRAQIYEKDGFVYIGINGWEQSIARYNGDENFWTYNNLSQQDNSKTEIFCNRLSLINWWNSYML